MGWRNRLLLAVILAGPAAALSIAWRLHTPDAAETAPQSQRSAAHSFSVSTRRYGFDPPRIEVFEGDLVRIELAALDIAHSFTIDEYRLSERVEPNRPVVFEFRASRAGSFPIYCNLQLDDGCRGMRAELVVKPRP